MQLINGRPAAVLPLTDRSIQFGDGVFRTLRKQNGQLLFWEAHYAKLAHDANALQMVCPPKALLESDLAQLTLTDATVKVILSRGNTARGYAIPEALSITRIIQETPLMTTAALSTGVAIRFADWRLAQQPRLAGIKHLNRLDNVMARLEWTTPAIFESLMLDQTGSVIAGVMSNLFIWQQGMLLTPELTACGVAGVMRDLVIAAAKQLTIDIRQVQLTPTDVLQAEAVMLTNSLIGIVPVKQCQDRLWQDFSICHSLYEQVFA